MPATNHLVERARQLGARDPQRVASGIALAYAKGHDKSQAEIDRLCSQLRKWQPELFHKEPNQ